jgi:hypothetical protein
MLCSSLAKCKQPLVRYSINSVQWKPYSTDWRHCERSEAIQTFKARDCRIAQKNMPSLRGAKRRGNRNDVSGQN